MATFTKNQLAVSTASERCARGLLGCESTATRTCGAPRSSAEQLAHTGRRSVPAERTARKTAKRRLDLAAKDTSRIRGARSWEESQAAQEGTSWHRTDARSPAHSQQAPRCASATARDLLRPSAEESPKGVI